MQVYFKDHGVEVTTKKDVIAYLEEELKQFESPEVRASHLYQNPDDDSDVYITLSFHPQSVLLDSLIVHNDTTSADAPRFTLTKETQSFWAELQNPSHKIHVDIPTLSNTSGGPVSEIMICDISLSRLLAKLNQVPVDLMMFISVNDTGSIAYGVKDY